MDQGSRTVNALVLIGLLALVCMLIMVPVLMGTSPQWSASGTSGGNVVVTTGTFTTTNTLGQTVTTTGLVTSTVSTGSTAAATTSATSTSLGQAILNIILSGTHNLLDENGNPIETGGLYQLYMLAPELFAVAGYIGPTTNLNTTVNALAVDATYEITGTGVDWNTLDVSCSVAGVTAQPSVANPIVPEIVNNPSAALHEWKDMKTKTGTLSHTATLASLLGGKSWDHGRKLTARLDVACSATAKPVAGYALAPGKTQLEASVGPVKALANMQWKEEPAPPSPPEPPGPTPAASPSSTYSETMAGAKGEPKGGGTKEPVEPGTLWGKAGVGNRGEIGWALLGMSPSLIEIYGATLDTSGSERLLAFAVVLVIGSVVAWFVLKRKPSLS